MSIVRLTDAEVRERIVEKDDRKELWDLAIEVTNQSFYTAGCYSIEGGVRVLVTDMSGKEIISENCPLPSAADLPIDTYRKREFIRVLKQRMRKLIKDEPKGAA